MFLDRSASRSLHSRCWGLGQPVCVLPPHVPRAACPKARPCPKHPTTGVMGAGEGGAGAAACCLRGRHLPSACLPFVPQLSDPNPELAPGAVPTRSGCSCSTECPAGRLGACKEPGEPLGLEQHKAHPVLALQSQEAVSCRAWCGTSDTEGTGGWVLLSQTCAVPKPDTQRCTRATLPSYTRVPAPCAPQPPSFPTPRGMLQPSSTPRDAAKREFDRLSPVPSCSY